MAVDYTRFFDRVKLYASAINNGDGFSAQVVTSKLHQMNVLHREDQDADNLKNLISRAESYQSNLANQSGAYGSLLNAYLSTEGGNEIQSANTRASLVASDLATFMTRDSETVLSNVLGASTSYSRLGDGAVTTLTQTQLAINDTITLTCTTAQEIATDAVFTVRSKRWGNISQLVLADGVTSHNLGGVQYGISALVVSGGTVGNYWAISDKIILTLTSDDASILMNVFRDNYNVLLPNSASPTISPTLADTVNAFPITNLYDGREVVLDGVRYYYSTTLVDWVASC